MGKDVDGIRVPVKIVRKREVNPDPSPVPDYMTDPEEVAPCPCGRPFTPDVIVIEGDVPLSRWFHPGCTDWLRHEMEPWEIEMVEEVERRMREQTENEEDE